MESGKRDVAAVWILERDVWARLALMTAVDAFARHVRSRLRRPVLCGIGLATGCHRK
jgi:hypothetical protein